MKPLDINWELNNICNLMCPQCERNRIVDGLLVRISNLNGWDNTLDMFVKQYENIKYDIERIRFDGEESESLSSADFLPICEYVHSKDIVINVSTNGSIKNPDYWYELGKEFSKNKESKIYFGLDGMGSELSLYRIGANYDRIIENTKAFIDGGGKAYWKMIVFKHNQHQVEDAKKESQRLGFEDFIMVCNLRRNNLEPFKHSFHPKTKKRKEYQLEVQTKFAESMESHSLKENQLYINYKGQVLNSYYEPDYEFLDEEHEWYKNYHSSEDTLFNKTLREILKW